MATESGFITLEDLKRQAEEIGLEGTEKTKFLTHRWKMIREIEVRKLKLAAEAQERKLAAEESRTTNLIYKKAFNISRNRNIMV